MTRNSSIFHQGKGNSLGTEAQRRLADRKGGGASLSLEFDYYFSTSEVGIMSDKVTVTTETKTELTAGDGWNS